MHTNGKNATHSKHLFDECIHTKLPRICSCQVDDTTQKFRKAINECSKFSSFVYFACQSHRVRWRKINDGETKMIWRFLLCLNPFLDYLKDLSRPPLHSLHFWFCHQGRNRKLTVSFKMKEVKSAKRNGTTNNGVSLLPTIKDIFLLMAKL